MVYMEDRKVIDEIKKEIYNYKENADDILPLPLESWVNYHKVIEILDKYNNQELSKANDKLSKIEERINHYRTNDTSTSAYASYKQYDELEKIIKGGKE